MIRYALRSIFFNVCFYSMTLLACITALPTLFLPRASMMWVVHSYLAACYFIERLILGLDFEVRGLDHLPKDGPYIIAAKHQSAYETLKLHVLFGDPAIVLKKELLSLPLWGKYLQKSDVIAIDRSTPYTAIKSIQKGAQRVAAQGRPIVIFPQGTRVAIGDKRRYNLGVTRVQEATGLPIIPLAMNTGYFWPRNSFLKRPGKVIFEILPPVEAGRPAADVLKHLETEIENHSDALLEEAKGQRVKTKPLLPTLIFIAGLYSALWFWAADYVQNKYTALLQGVENVQRITATPQISGFPGPITLYAPQEILHGPKGSVEINALRIQSWPFPGANILAETGEISIHDQSWNGPLRFLTTQTYLRGDADKIIIDYAELASEETLIKTSGIIDLISATNNPYPDAQFAIIVANPEEFLMQLSQNDILNHDQAMMIAAGIKGFQNAGENTIPLRLDGGAVYIGPFRLARLP